MLCVLTQAFLAALRNRLPGYATWPTSEAGRSTSYDRLRCDTFPQVHLQDPASSQIAAGARTLATVS